MSKQKKQMDAPDREQGSRVNKNTAKRLLSYIGAYKKTLVVVFICIILSALASVASAMFIEILIDDYITPILAMGSSGLYRADQGTLYGRRYLPDRCIFYMVL